MLIGEFARQTGLSQDTVRFYVRKGLLTPRFGAKGGRHPWQVFTAQDVSAARLIRFAQSLGMSLKEISEIDAELRRDSGSAERATDMLDAQLARLERQAAELAELLAHLRAKRDGIKRGKSGDEPCSSTVNDPAPSSEQTNLGARSSAARKSRSRRNSVAADAARSGGGNAAPR